MSKITKIVVYINVVLLTFFMNMADITSGHHLVTGISGIELPRVMGVPATLFSNTNPVYKKRLGRGIASDETDTSKNDKTKVEEKKENEESESFSLLDPNLYEGDSDGASDILQIDQINSRINQ